MPQLSIWFNLSNRIQPFRSTVNASHHTSTLGGFIMQKFYSSYGHLYSNVRTGSAAINQFLGTFQVSEWRDQAGDQRAHHLDPYQLHLFWELCVSRHQEADFRWFFTQYVAPLKENQAQLQQEWRDPYNQQLGTNPDLNRHPHESICSYWTRLAG
jgi:hypothetical protein